MQGAKGGSLELEVNVNVNAREVDFPVRGPIKLQSSEVRNATWRYSIHFSHLVSMQI